MPETTAQSEPTTSVPATSNLNAIAVPSAVGTSKNAIPKLQVIRAAQLKPCDSDTIPGKDADAEPVRRPLLVYVTADGQQVSVPCTPTLFSAVEDARMDMYDDRDFLIYIDRRAGVAVRVEPLKRQDCLRGRVPAELEGVKLVEFDVDTVNGFATVHLYPAKVERELVLQMKAELDAATVVTPGARLLGRFPIVDVRGGVGGLRVSVNPFAK